MTEIIEVLKKIESFGYKAYVVGGFPRDLYIGKTSIDIDICTNAKPKKIIKMFEVENSDGIKYGVVKIKYKSKIYEITTFRKEKKYINNRIPTKIKYVNNLIEDLYRRDFVINTLCLDSNGNYIDLLGARKDIDNKIINMVGNPYYRLKEDCLRILRAVRFATILNFKLSDEIKKSIIENKELIKKLSYERKKEELDKIFSSENSSYGMHLLEELQLIDVLDLNKQYIDVKNPLAMWVQLDTELKYPYTIEERKTIENIRKLLNEDLSDKYILYKSNINDLEIVCDIKKIDFNKIKERYENLIIKNRKDINIDADEICSILNIEDKSMLKEIYITLEKVILKEKVQNDKKEIKDFLLTEYKK